MPAAEQDAHAGEVARSTRWIVLWAAAIVASVTLTFVGNGSRGDHFHSTIAALRDSSLRVANDLPDSIRKADAVFYTFLDSAAEARAELGSDTLALLLIAAYGPALSPLRPVLKPFQPRVAFEREHGKNQLHPELLRQCLIGGFTYRVQPDTLDGLPGILLKGHWEKHFADEKEAAVDMYVTAIRWRLERLRDLRRLFLLGLNVKTDPGLAHSHAAQDSVDNRMRRKFGDSYKFLADRLPYSLVYMRGYEVRMHAYDLELDEGHAIEFHQELFIAKVRRAPHGS